jgi:hypothetical protein
MQGTAYPERVHESEELLAELAEEVEGWLDMFSHGVSQSEDAAAE